jgi:hypothetical protein
MTSLFLLVMFDLILTNNFQYQNKGQLSVDTENIP